jgi:lipoyl(octanoyl) transferase
MTATAAPRTLRWGWLGRVPYREAWDLQVALAQQRRDGALDSDVVLLLEHPPVYTMGRNGEPHHLRDGAAALRAAGAEYVDVDRGGSVTFHGPGQLVAYPILLLAEAFPIAAQPGYGDVEKYLRALEQGLIGTAATYGVQVTRRPPYTGVWRDNDKLGAIGVKLARGVTTHGVALNVCTDLAWFYRVIPCGIDGAGVASLATLGAPGLTPRDVAPVLAAQLASAFGVAAPVKVHGDALRGSSVADDAPGRVAQASLSAA